MSSSIQALVAGLRPWARALILEAARVGLQPRLTSTRRSHSQQARLYRRFLAGLSEFPVAAPGHSAHELGLAFDLIVTPLTALADLGNVWEGWGGTWGGRFHDPIHFEAPGVPHYVASKTYLDRLASHPLVEIASYFAPITLQYSTDPTDFGPIVPYLKKLFHTQ
jgi:hypothetical protein